jgi:pimeloyl-ACP methyl ester carboxylesterase
MTISIEGSLTVAETTGTAGAAFREGFVEADGFRIRYAEAGQGPALVHLHGAGGMRLNAGHGLLARYYRVIAFEMPGFGASPENSRTQTMAEYSTTMVRACDALGIDQFNMWGTSFGGKAAVWLAVRHPERVQALVLEAPAAIRPAGARGPSGSPEQMARALYGHPERMPPLPATDPAVQAKQQALTGRLRGPDRDAELEAGMRRLSTPTLVLFGTLDRVIPPEMGRHYKELMPGNSNLALVYDAGHAIAAERPEAFAEIVADFLDRHAAFAISRTETLLFP